MNEKIKEFDLIVLIGAMATILFVVYLIDCYHFDLIWNMNIPLKVPLNISTVLVS